MPKDCASFPAVVDVALPGGRRGKLLPADDAGSFRVHCHSTIIDRLFAAGWIDDAERDAAAALHRAFDGSGLQPHVVVRYDGVHIDRGSGGGDDPFERMTAAEHASWRELHRFLAKVPAAYRPQVQAVCCWDSKPWSLAGLREGLRVLADALHRRRR